jgi:hypothetical protein
MKSDDLRPSNSMNPKMKIAVATTLDVARQGDSNADTNREPSHFGDSVDTRCEQGVRSALITNLDSPFKRLYRNHSAIKTYRGENLRGVIINNSELSIRYEERNC